MIQYLASGFDVKPLLAQLEANPSVWDRYTLRTDRYQTPHSKISDVWVRFRKWEDYTGDPVAFTMNEHTSEWYAAADEIPAVKELAQQVMDKVDGKELGGILITRIPPHGEVKPHIDSGWHAGYYEKFAIQLQGNLEQAFCFEDSTLSPLPGDLYTFDNSKVHWVVNPTDEPRMTVIFCIKRAET